LKSLTPSSSRPSTPQLISFSPNNRDTLISSESKSMECLSTSSSSPTVSVSSGFCSLENGQSKHDKPHKVKPDASSKTTKLTVPQVKISSSPNSNPSPLMTKGEPTAEVQPVQRKSKYNRRKMTEEEAVKELGLLTISSIE